MCTKAKKIIFSYKYLTHLSFKYADYCSFLINKNNYYQSIFKLLIKTILQIACNCDCIKIDNISTKDNLLILFYTKLKTKIYKAQLFSTIETPSLIFNKQFNINRSHKLDNNDTLRRRNILKKNNYKFNINDINNSEAWNKIISFRKEKYGLNSILNSKENQYFFKSLNNINPMLSTLEVNNEIVAVHYGFIYNEIFYYYIPVYESKMKQYGVGKILILEIIEWCIKNDIKEFDMLMGIEKYKIPWANMILDNKTFFAIVNSKLKNIIIYYFFLSLIFYRKFIK